MTIPEQVRALLRQYRGGLSIPVITEKTGIRTNRVDEALKRMPDTWIERWENPNRSRPRAVWCVMPLDAAPPRKK